MPPKKRAPVSGGAPPLACPPATAGGRPAACPGCGSVACAMTGLTFCRHTGQARDPDPTAAARLAALRTPIRSSVRSAA
jgi:hypothetical protein